MINSKPRSKCGPKPASTQAKRAFSFIDGQNVYQSARELFGYNHPNFDPSKLHEQICSSQNWTPVEVRLYTGLPHKIEQPAWAHWWEQKLSAVKKAGVRVATRKLRYQKRLVLDDDGEPILENGAPKIVVGTKEKGIDVRMALDIVALARSRAYDVAIMFSQDQDLKEVAFEINAIAKEQGRRIQLVSAYPWSATAPNKRGVNKTDWLKISKEMYDKCIDPTDYREVANKAQR
jgi:uncharacterized LabA/DUF88 family protein